MKLLNLHINRGSKPHTFSGPRGFSDQDLHWRYKCGICGFSGVDTRRDSLGDGDGRIDVINTDGDEDFQHTGGCPFCNSRNWI